MGSENLKDLIVDEFSSEEIVFLDLEPKERKNTTLLFRVYRILFFLYNISKTDMLYCIFVRENTGFYCKIANLLHKKVIYHWAGTDLFNMEKGKFRLGKYKECIDLHCTYAVNLHNELLDFNIDSVIFPIVPIGISKKCANMPKEHSVLISIPDDTMERAQFYGFEITTRLIKSFPDLMFYVVRSTHPEYYPYSNVIHKGLISSDEMNALYEDISIILRFPEHDGQSLLLMEGTVKGKYMLYNHDMPYTIKVSSFEQAKKALENILSQPPVPQIETSLYGIDNYNAEVCKRQFKTIISGVLDE